MANTCYRSQYNETHPTCRSCEEQVGSCSKKRRRIKAATTVRTWHSGRSLFTTHFVHGLNAWVNKNRSNYLAVKKEWENVLAGTVFLWGKATGKRLVTIERIVTSRGHLIQDEDNLQGCFKPVNDLLVKQGVLIDDSREYVTTEITQKVGPKQGATITVQDMEGV